MKLKYLIIFITIFAIDLATKLLALNILPFQEDVFLLKDKISLFLIYNEGSTGGQADYLTRQEPNKNLAVMYSSLSGLILLGYLSFVFNRRFRRLYKWLIGLGIVVFNSMVFQLIKPYLLHIEITNWTASVISKIVAICFYFAIFLLTKNNLIKLFSIIIISAGVGNLINHFYYPYQVIDFIYIRGTYELFKIGIFNVADLAFDIGIIGLIVSIIISLVKKKKNYGT